MIVKQLFSQNKLLLTLKKLITMKKTFTKLFLLFAFAIVVSSTTQAQTSPCTYTFTYNVSGTTVTFNNTPDIVIGGIVPQTISWTWDTTNFSNTNDPIFTGATPGYHIVCMIVVNFNCINNPTQVVCDTIFIGGTTGISQNDLAKTIAIFPNPSNGNVNINSAFAEIENISVYNALGQIVFEEKNPALKNELDLSILTDGIYIVKTKTPHGVVTKKITINK